MTPEGKEAPPLCLVEQRRAEVDAKLDDLFADPNTPQRFLVHEVSRLLESDSAPVTRAIVDNGWTLHVAQYPISRQPVSIENGNAGFSHDQVRQLNQHPYVRTLSFETISKILDVSMGMLVKAAKINEITPIIPYEGYIRYSEQHPHAGINGRYDLDQVVQLREAVKHFNAPEDSVALSAIENRLGLHPEFIRDVAEELELGPLYYRNPDRGTQELYVTKQQAAQLLHRIGQKRKRA